MKATSRSQRSQPLGLSGRCGPVRTVTSRRRRGGADPGGRERAEHDIGGKRPAGEAEHRKRDDRVVAEAVDEGEERLHRGLRT